MPECVNASLNGGAEQRVFESGVASSLGLSRRCEDLDPSGGSRDVSLFLDRGKPKQVLLPGGFLHLSGRLTVPPASMVILGILRREEMVAVGWVPTLLMLYVSPITEAGNLPLEK